MRGWICQGFPHRLTRRPVLLPMCSCASLPWACRRGVGRIRTVIIRFWHEVSHLRRRKEGRTPGHGQMQGMPRQSCCGTLNVRKADDGIGLVECAAWKKVVALGGSASSRYVVQETQERCQSGKRHPAPLERIALQSCDRLQQPPMLTAALSAIQAALMQDGDVKIRRGKAERESASIVKRPSLLSPPGSGHEDHLNCAVLDRKRIWEIANLQEA